MTQRDYPYTVQQIEAMLLGSIDRLAETLLPGGRRHGAERLNGYALGHELSSFSLNLSSGKWIHGAAARRSGRDLPLLSLVAYLVTDDRWASKDDRVGAIKWALDWLGLTDTAPNPARSRALAEKAQKAAAARAKADAAAAEKRRQAAYAMWLNAREVEPGDPVWTYLAGRGIDLSRLTALPGCLRYDPACRFYETHDRYTSVPAMLSAMHLEGVPAGFAAVHRTYLAAETEIFGGKIVTTGRWQKAFGKHSKTILGPKSGATIRLTKGESGKPLSRAPDGEWVAVAEGIENALSAAMVRPDLRVLAAGTLENIGKIVLPPQIAGVLILADNDAFGSSAEAGLESACNALLERGLDVEIYRAPAGFKDFNDALTGKKIAQGES